MLLNKLYALSLCAFIVSCGDKNVAKDYLDSGAGNATADSNPADQTGDQKPEVGEETDTKDPTDETGEETPAGDATKGAALMQNCAACHNANGLGKAVTLNEKAIPRLDEAFNGQQKAIHSVFAEAFEQPGRADLEAALKAIK